MTQYRKDGSAIIREINLQQGTPMPRVLNPLRSRIWLAITLVLLPLAMSGCAKVPRLGVYKLDIQQGNIVTEEMLARLEPGMDKRKVRFILGTPLVADTFSTNRWDYLYTFKQAGQSREQRHIVVIFEGESLNRVEGDVVPGVLDLAPQERREAALVAVPDRADTSLWGRLGSFLGGGQSRRTAVAEPATELEEVTVSSLDAEVTPSVTAVPAPAATTAPSDEEPGLEPEVIVVDEPPAASASLLGSDEQTPAAPGEDTGFLESLKKRAAGQEKVADGGTDGAESSQPADKTGFFQRLANKFGLEAPAEPGRSGENR